MGLVGNWCKRDENGNVFLDKNHLHYFQVQTGMAVAGLKTCVFFTYTSKGIYIVTIQCARYFMLLGHRLVKAAQKKIILSNIGFSKSGITPERILNYFNFKMFLST